MGQALPNVVTESGWAESMPRMQDDKKMVLTGLNYAVKIYITAKWEKLLGGRVSGRFELYKHGCGDIPTLDQAELPATTNTQTLKIKRRDLFGGTLLRRCNGQDILYLPVEYLHLNAEQAIRELGFFPA